MRSCATILFCLLIVFNVCSQAAVDDIPYTSIDSIAKQLKQQDDITNFIYACLDTFLANPTENRLVIFDQCERFRWRALKTSDEYLAWILLHCNKGYYAGLFGDIYQAVDAYENAWKVYGAHTPKGVDIIEYCLKPLGNSYSMLGDYQSAANVIKNYLFIAEKENNGPHMIAALINLSVVYHDTGRQAEAIELLEKGLDVTGINNLKKGILYSNLARNWLDLQHNAEAHRCALLAIKHLKIANTPEGHSHVVNTLKILSLLSLDEGNVMDAMRFIENAKAIVKANPSLFQSRTLAKLMAEYAGLLVMQQEHDLALQHYQQALMLLLPGYTPENGTDLPDKALFYPENAIKEVLDGLARLHSKDAPMKAVACFELSFEIDELLRHTYHYQTDKLRQQIEVRNRTEECLEMLFERFAETNEQHLVHYAFQLAERTKAVVLREAIATSAKHALIKDDSLLKKEHDLNFKKARLARDLVLEQMKGESANVAYIAEVIAHQTTLSIEIRSLQKLIREKYPRYTEVEHHVIDLKRLQLKLERDDAILMEYVAGQESIYVFIVDAQSIAFHKIPSGKDVYDAIRTLNDLFASASRIHNDIALYKRIAFELTDLLHVPTAKTAEKLVIIPDGLINYVPFEALLVAQTSASNYATLPYLLKAYTIAYGPSATAFAAGKNTGSLKHHKVLGVFPVFKNTSRNLAHAETEARSIQSYVEGIFLFGPEATKRAFGENLRRCNIIHLSTHAAAGSGLAPPSIEFIDSTLYLPEIYGLQLQPDLLVLSACETGVGKILKGEGALSLARGFQYAGASNIMFSLWNVNDRSTARLMASFFKHYFNQQSKPKALQRSKLDYLENPQVSNAHKSPYYWAPFVYYGDVSTPSLQQEAEIVWLEMLLSILAFLVLLVLFAWTRKQRIL